MVLSELRCFNYAKSAARHISIYTRLPGAVTTAHVTMSVVNPP